MIALVHLLAAATLAFTEADADFAYACASNLVVRHPVRNAGTGRGCSAAYWILDEASIAGVDMRRDPFQARALVDGKMTERSFVNLYCTFPGSNAAPWVVFVSHFDTKPGVACPGANDGASTTGLLMALAAAMSERGRPGKANIMLLWTDGEECLNAYGPDDGFWGSRRAAAEFKRRGVDVRAVVCLDMLGDRNLNISIPSNGSETLSRIAQIAATRAGFPANGLSRISELVKDDHVPFLEAGYSAIDLIDFDFGSKPGRNDWWHTPQDTLDKIDRASLLKSGRLVAELINILAK